MFHNLLAPPDSYLSIVISSFVVYFFIVLGIRLFGKKEITQLSITDLVFILLISNAVQNAMVGPDATLTGGLVAAGTLFLTNYLFKQLLYRFPRLGRIIQGEAIMLIYRGGVNNDNLRRARITNEELLETLREHGLEYVSDVELAVLEVDGNISVVPFEKKHNPKKEGETPPA